MTNSGQAIFQVEEALKQAQQQELSDTAKALQQAINEVQECMNSTEAGNNAEH
ncbi:MAG: hypothetical protein IMW92_05160 [Bacillales bacterium]|nr:hypothetical protein [Bacillales bacterium]